MGRRQFQARKRRRLFLACIPVIRSRLGRVESSTRRAGRPEKGDPDVARRHRWERFGGNGGSHTGMNFAITAAMRRLFPAPILRSLAEAVARPGSPWSKRTSCSRIGDSYPVRGCLVKWAYSSAVEQGTHYGSERIRAVLRKCCKIAFHEGRCRGIVPQLFRVVHKNRPTVENDGEISSLLPDCRQTNAPALQHFALRRRATLENGLKVWKTGPSYARHFASDLPLSAL